MDTGSKGHSGKDRQDLTDRKGQTGYSRTSMKAQPGKET